MIPLAAGALCALVLLALTPRHRRPHAWVAIWCTCVGVLVGGVVVRCTL